MGTCFMYGNGGGSDLNFNVVGGTSQPANPKENTIWVNTGTTISGWVFSSTTPVSPAEGMVWISTGASSTVEFNALKKNGIQVYPTSAMQYVSGAWVSKTTLVYTSGEWNELATYLYSMGDECTALTGGWYSEAKLQSSTSTATATAPTITRGTTYIKAALTSASKAGIFTFYNSVSLKDYSKLVIEGEFVSGGNSGNTKLAIWSSISTWYDTNIVASKELDKNVTYKTLEIDVSSLTGSYRIGFGMSSHGGTSCSITINKAMLIK